MEKKEMKIYGISIDREQLANEIEKAEIESMRCNRLDYIVVLNTETGELYQWEKPCGDNGVTQRIWDGTDRILYTTNNQFFDAFRDWLASGYSEDEMNDFCRNVVGNEVYAKFEQRKNEEEEEDPVWELIWIDGNYCDELRESVVSQFEDALMENLDTDALLDRIEKEHMDSERRW